MKRSVTAAMCTMIVGLFGCSAGAGGDVDGASDDALRHTGSKELTCDAGSGKLALVAIKDGKFALVSLKAAGRFFAVSGINGELTTSASRWKWTGGRSSLSLDGDLKGTWEREGHSTQVTCKTSTTEDAASFKAANALTDYANEIDGIADAVLENTDNPNHKAYTVYAVATSERDSLSLGTTVRDSAGKLPGSDDDESRIDENDFSYGAMSAAYSLGGGDDYGEWFQGVSDGVSLDGDLGPSVTNAARAGFIAREKVTALASLVDSAKPSAVEITVGPWTYFLPDAFPK